MAKTSQEKLEELQKREAQIKAQIQAIKQRESKAERTKDTRRKILIGGAILAKVKRGEWHQSQLNDLLNAELKSDRDRELFDLPPMTTGATTGGNQ